MIYELAKDVQSEVNQLEQSVRDLVQGQLRIRKDINDVRGDIIRHDENFAQIEVQLDRIAKRLGLIDA
jgi:predicted  nucleic acid-binding Zn-ribbon protein